MVLYAPLGMPWAISPILVGTVFGVATSKRIGVVLLSVGFSLIFGLEDGLTMQIGPVVGAVT